MKKTLREQLEAFKEGNILNYDGGINDWNSNFYDWFCKDTSLENKAHKLFNQVAKFVASRPDIDLDKHYVFFKNNCPFNGPLYDDFRIVDSESGDILFTVVPKCGHSGLAEIWGKENDFQGAIKTSKTFTGLLK